MIGSAILDIEGLTLGTGQSTDVQHLSHIGDVDMTTALTYGGLRMPQVEDEITSMSYNDCQSTFHGFPIALKKKVWIEYVFFDKRGLNAFYWNAYNSTSGKGGIRGLVVKNKSMYFILKGHNVGNANFADILPYDGVHPELSYYYLGAQPKIEISNDASKNIKGTIKMQFIQIQGVMLNSIIPVETRNAYNAIVSEER